jgi:hypothetical protein
MLAHSPVRGKREPDAELVAVEGEQAFGSVL